jgi:hypothetical protein
MSQVLGTFGLLDFTVLWPVLTWRVLRNVRTIYFFNFPIFFSGHGEPWITNRRCRITGYGGTSVSYFSIIHEHTDAFALS